MFKKNERYYYLG